MRLVLGVAAMFAAAAGAPPHSAPSGVPLPNARQLAFMDLEHTNFFHFGLPTFWDPPVRLTRTTLRPPVRP
jgi:hypothetical protein